MRTVELVKGVNSSALGFGCAPILGSIDKKKARRAIDLALEYGINHFDLARSYGYGEAEKFVGSVLKGRRDKVVLASKFGIRANWKAELLRPVKPLVRVGKMVMKKSSKENAYSNKNSASISNKFLNKVAINRREMCKSLDKSLSELKTSYLDYFLIHDPDTSLSNLEDLATAANDLKVEGKIRAWGLAFMSSSKEKHDSYLNKFDVLQFNISPGVPEYEATVIERGLYSNIIFSPITGGTNDLKPTEKLIKLFDSFPHSVILCSMFNEKHLIENVKALI